MEKIFNVAKDTLKEVLQNRSDYFEVANKVGKTLQATEEERMKSLILVAAFFRHYYFIRELNSFIFFNENEQKIDLQIATGLYFVNNAYVKVVSEEAALTALKEVGAENEVTFLEKEDNRLLALNHIVFEKRKFAFPKIKVPSQRFFSVKFNLPEWFIRMVVKHYGKTEGLNICREISHSQKQYFVQNGFKPASPDPKGELEGFQNVKENVYVYSGKAPYKKNFYVTNKNLINVQLGFLDLLEKLPKITNGTYTLYLGFKTYAYMPIIHKYFKDNNNATIITKEMKENYELLSLKKTYKLKNVYYNEAKTDSLESLISKKQDLVMLFASSSEFEKFRTSPDYQIIFDQSKLDGYIASELQDLENVAPYVADKGTLVYLVRTLGHKETDEIIATFLEKHEDFELVEEKQYLPYQAENSLFYYAILKKKA